MALKPGDRIGAIADEDENEVKLLGYGVYEGDFTSDMYQGEPMPRLKLDDGTAVWGFFCTWGSEDRVKREIGDRKVVGATMHDALMATLRTHLEEEKASGMDVDLVLASRVAMSLSVFSGSTTDLLNQLTRDVRRANRVAVMAQAILLASMVMCMADGTRPDRPTELPLDEGRRILYEKIVVDLTGWINRSLRSLVPADDFDPIHLRPEDRDQTD